MNDRNPRVNALGQPIGFDLPDWRPPPRPPRTVITGRYCRVEPLESARHGPDLHAAYSLDREGRLWTYLFSGPFATEGEFMQWLAPRQSSEDPLFFAIVDVATGRAGRAVALPAHRSGARLHRGRSSPLSPRSSARRASTEAMYLMMKHAFDLGYRRYEWKCDSLNAPSRHAAERLGFTFEGIFRQAIVLKGRNRDTAWFSIVDHEWPAAERRSRHGSTPAISTPQAGRRTD